MWNICGSTDVIEEAPHRDVPKKNQNQIFTLFSNQARKILIKKEEKKSLGGAYLAKYHICVDSDEDNRSRYIRR